MMLRLCGAGPSRLGSSKSTLGCDVLTDSAAFSALEIARKFTLAAFRNYCWGLERDHVQATLSLALLACRGTAPTQRRAYLLTTLRERQAFKNDIDWRRRTGVFFGGGACGEGSG